MTEKICPVLLAIETQLNNEDVVVGEWEVNVPMEALANFLRLKQRFGVPREIDYLCVDQELKGARLKEFLLEYLPIGQVALVGRRFILTSYLSHVAKGLHHLDRYVDVFGKSRSKDLIVRIPMPTSVSAEEIRKLLLRPSRDPLLRDGYVLHKLWQYQMLNRICGIDVNPLKAIAYIVTESR